MWLSDIHLGSRGCQAEALGAFLKRVECDTLYLVGDIVDFWRLRRGRAWWPNDHNEVIRRVLKIVKRGARVVLVPGNHDEAFRQYAGLRLGGIEVVRECVHECADGRRLLITHGDSYDLVVTHSKLIALIGAAAYEWLIVVNGLYNRGRRLLGKPYWSLAQFIKMKVKSACTYVSRYEDALLHVVRERKLDGVVCGHIHRPHLDESDRAAAPAGRAEGSSSGSRCTSGRAA